MYHCDNLTDRSILTEQQVRCSQPCRRIFYNCDLDWNLLNGHCRCHAGICRWHDLQHSDDGPLWQPKGKESPDQGHLMSWCAAEHQMFRHFSSRTDATSTINFHCTSLCFLCLHCCASSACFYSMLLQSFELWAPFELVKASCIECVSHCFLGPQLTIDRCSIKNVLNVTNAQC